MSDEEIKAAAIEFAKTHKKQIAKELTDVLTYLPEAKPVSIFMAGSPGAGKTEFSKAYLGLFEDNKKAKVIRIDADELRTRIPGYTGTNSYLFQGAVSILVEKIHDLVLEKKQSFILDGTLSKYEKALLNIDRSLHAGRSVSVFYVYQAPEIAWKFTQSREVLEGRNIQRDVFIQEFLEANATIHKLCEKYDGQIMIILIKKNFQTHEVEIVELIKSGAEIDGYIGQTYTEEDLRKLL